MASTLPCLPLLYLILPYLPLLYLTLPSLAFPCLASPCLTLPYLALPYLTLPVLTFPYDEEQVGSDADEAIDEAEGTPGAAQQSERCSCERCICDRWWCCGRCCCCGRWCARWRGEWARWRCEWGALLERRKEHSLLVFSPESSVRRLAHGVLKAPSQALTTIGL